MTRKLFALGTILTLAVVLYAQGATAVKIEGYLIDNACAGAHAKDADFAETAKKHTKSCALMPPCAGSGYAVFSSDAKLYKLDKAGNEKAEALLKDTETKSGITVTVEGTVDGDTIKVTKISEKTE